MHERHLITQPPPPHIALPHPPIRAPRFRISVFGSGASTADKFGCDFRPPHFLREANTGTTQASTLCPKMHQLRSKRLWEPNRVERRVPAEAGKSSRPYGTPAGQENATERATRRVSFPGLRPRQAPSC
jgi:hypothetical protein